MGALVISYKKTDKRKGDKKMKKKYIILVEGCDDDTIIEKDLTLNEFKLIQSVAKEITKTSNYQCMPRMYIKEKEK